jgi:predicted N-acetyltransferase YhbS
MLGGGVRVRRLRADDIPAVDPIMRAAYGVERPYAERIAAYLRQRGTLPLVAEHDSRVAGAVFGLDYTTSAYVALMGVAPALHRRGIGNALMTALMAWSDERGFRDVRLDATPAGAPLYERFGFADFGERSSSRAIASCNANRQRASYRQRQAMRRRSRESMRRPSARTVRRCSSSCSPSTMRSSPPRGAATSSCSG